MRQIAAAPAEIGVGRLQMGRQRIMDIAADAMIEQVCSQRIARSALDHEQVIDMARLIDRQCDRQIGEQFTIPAGPRATGGIPDLKAPQLNAQRGGLDLVEARIAPTVLNGYIFLAPAIKAQPAQARRQIFVGGTKGAGIAQSAEILEG